MKDMEIEQLQKLKKKLLIRATQLENKLKDQENKHQLLNNYILAPPSDKMLTNDEDYKSSELQSKYKAKLCEIAAQVTGITFKYINKKWLCNNTFIYKAKVITTTIFLNLELTVSMDSDDFKIDNIICHFINVKDCYMLEIFPWFEKIRNTKNFSLLISALSDYNEHNTLRLKILYNLKSKKYVTVQQNTQENSGILLYIHSPMNIEEKYMIFQWTIKFLEPMWRVENFFTIKITDTGIKFSEENQNLIKEFCKPGLAKDKFVELWDKLCIAIDNYTKGTNA